MRVLFLLGNLSGGGGTERVTCDLASTLAVSGDEVSILSVFGPAVPFFRLADNVTVRSLGHAEARGSPIQAMRISYALWREIKLRSPEVVIAVDSVLFAFLLPLAVSRGTRLICWEHFHLNTSHGTALRKIGRRVAAQVADRIVVLTSRDSDAWRARFGPRTRVEAIPNAVPPLEAPAETIKQYRGKHVLLAVGRMTRQKGFDLLLDAWFQVAHTRPEWRLRIVGDGEERENLEEQVVRLDLGDKVEMPGQIRNMAREYANADVFVMSSRWEGLPMVLLEAQQAGLPTVSSDCETGPREILGDSSGLLVPSENSLELAAALCRVTADAKLRESLSAAARENARRYKIDAIAARWQELLRGASSNGPSP